VPARARRSLLLALAAVSALALVGCGGSGSKGPADLVFVSTKDGDYAIFGADANGKGIRRLTKEKGDPETPQGLFFQVEPAWSPDGTRIAFSSWRDGTSHIYVMSADGSGTRRVTNGLQEDTHPSWSPDGRRIVFSREGAVFVVPANGGRAGRLGRGLGNAANPAWSPDGALIAYDYRRPGFSSRELYVMRSDGSGNRQVTRLGRSSSLPAWSPDGTRIAFQSNARLEHFEVYTIGVDGKGLRQVTLSVADVIQPAWAPDGRVSFSRDGELWVNADGKQTRLTSGGNDSNPAWRPSRPE
jgi:Tol biopolymer transport system component